MFRNNKYKIIFTTFITLLPILIGVECWNRLPDKMPIHFGADGTPDGWSAKTFVVFGFPAILAVLHLLCIFIASADPKHKNISKKVFSLVLWIVPVASLFCTTMIYANALGVTLDINIWTSALLGVMFMIFGNYLPKCRQNDTIGIKLPWTLADEENWDRTHRIAGGLWVVCGIAFFLNIVSESATYLIVVIAIAVVVPMVYSLILHLKKSK